MKHYFWLPPGTKMNSFLLLFFTPGVHVSLTLSSACTASLLRDLHLYLCPKYLLLLITVDFLLIMFVARNPLAPIFSLHRYSYKNQNRFYVL